LAVKKCIYLLPTYLHFMQDIEDRCLLLTSSTSFIDLPFQKHRMMEKYHMDQNPYISPLCPKLGVVSDNMTWEDDMAKAQAQPTQDGADRPHSLARRPCFALMKLHFQHVSCYVSKKRIRGGKVCAAVCHTPFRERRNEASIRVHRMFKSHV
jgi:hypothetical protein